MTQRQRSAASSRRLRARSGRCGDQRSPVLIQNLSHEGSYAKGRKWPWCHALLELLKASHHLCVPVSQLCIWFVSALRLAIKVQALPSSIWRLSFTNAKGRTAQVVGQCVAPGPLQALHLAPVL